MSDLVRRGRKTIYRGITMRSRLEASFAGWLDRNGFTWQYEPFCFADQRGQYLPDFCVFGVDPTFGCDWDAVEPATWQGALYIEVKPPDFDEAKVRRQMQTIWSTNPSAHLLIASPRYLDGEWPLGIGAHSHSQIAGEEPICDPRWSVAGMALCGGCRRHMFHNWEDSYRCPRCGEHDGDHHLGGWFDNPFTPPSS